MSVDGSHVQICAMRAQHRDIIGRKGWKGGWEEERGCCAGLKAIPQGESPMGLVSQRKPTCVISKGHSQM